MTAVKHDAKDSGKLSAHLFIKCRVKQFLYNGECSRRYDL